MSPPRGSDLALLGRLLREARPYRLHILALFAVGLLAVPLAMLAPLPLKIVADSALGAVPMPRALVPPGVAPSPALALAVATALLIAVAALRQLQDVAQQTLRVYVQERMTLDARARLFLHAQHLPLSHHDRRGTSDAFARIDKDVAAAQSIVVESLLPSLTAGLTVLGMLFVTARIDLGLAVAAAAVAPALFFLNRHFRGRLRQRWHEQRRLETWTLAVIHEVLGALRVVKAFGQEDRERERFAGRANEGLRSRVRLALAEGRFGVMVGLVMALGTAVVLVVGARQVRSGAITLGELLMVMGYLAQLYEPLKTMSRRVTGLQSKFTSVERVFSVLDSVPDAVDRPGAQPLLRARGEFEFRRVTFCHDPARPVLRDVSFHVPAGSRVGIEGPTGAGKTTLLSLLLRLYDPLEGAILLDGVDLREHRVRDLRRQYAVVLQEPVLFSTTVAENIAYGRPGASHDEIVAAARAANAHDFIARLPQGYDTPVGERGMTLSGGERQRVSLARAFLRDAPILILDEPTSAVDVRSEALILEALERLMEGRTTFVVAHRLSTLEGCDLRLEVERGRLASVRSRAS